MSVAIADTAASHEALQRQAMIDSQLRTNVVIDPAMLKAVASIERSRFVPTEQKAMTYSDRAIPLSGGRAINPVLTSTRLIGDTELTPGAKVLLIGAATGYTAALLVALGAEVVAVESDAALAAHARDALSDIFGVTLVEGPLADGAPAHAPYDILIVDGAIDAFPETLLAQVKSGGRIAGGLVERSVTRLVRAVHIDGSPTHPYAFADLECVLLPGFSKPAGFTF